VFFSPKRGKQAKRSPFRGLPARSGLYFVLDETIFFPGGESDVVRREYDTV